MKKDTLEEIIANWKKEMGCDCEGEHEPQHTFSLDINGYAEWLRTTLTSYRNDVLEEVLEGMPTKIFIDPILGRRSIYNDGWNECIDKIRHLIKSLKVDI